MKTTQSLYKLQFMNDYEELKASIDTPTGRRTLALINAEWKLIDDLVAFRKSRGLSQLDVAKLLGITQPAVAAFENHENDPKYSTLIRYCLAIEAEIQIEVKAAKDPGTLPIA